MLRSLLDVSVPLNSISLHVKIDVQSECEVSSAQSEEEVERRSGCCFITCDTQESDHVVVCEDGMPQIVPDASDNGIVASKQSESSNIISHHLQRNAPGILAICQCICSLRSVIGGPLERGSRGERG